MSAFTTRLATLAALLALATGLPGDLAVADACNAVQNGTLQAGACVDPECKKPAKRYEQIANTQPGYQWGDAGGFCGSFATQRAAMAKGAWISQEQVRNHTSHGAPGSHDEEILDTNIAKAWANLKLTFEAFDYRQEPTPQVDEIRTFMKKQLAAGHVVVMMIQKVCPLQLA